MTAFRFEALSRSRARIDEPDARPRSSLVGLTLGVIAIGVEGLVISPVLDDIATAFDIGVDRAGLAVAAYGLSLAIVAPTVALAGHRFSRKTTMGAGLVLFIVAGLLCAASRSFWMLMTARALCGAAAGAFLPSCYAYVADTTSYENRGRVMGRVMAGWSVALVLGVPMGGLIAQACGWRATFVAVSLLGGMAACLVARMPDAPGSKSSSLTQLRLVVASAVPRLLLVNFLDMLSFYAVYTFLGAAVRASLKIGSGTFSIFVLCYGAGLMLSTMNARVLDRFGKEKVMVVALVSLAALLAVLGPSIGQAACLLACMLVWGMVQGIVQTGTACLVASASADARGLAMACMSCTTYLAVGIGSMVGGWVLAAYGFGVLALVGTLAALGAGVSMYGFRPVAA